MGLQEYHKKRNFKKTLEPRGKRSTTKDKRIFVVQKHAASHLHYDFRLEFDGVLKSWAIPKGPSLNPHEKRLAIEVEDHPMDYAYFEGSIPKGEYGGGDVIVWDRGEWLAPQHTRAALKKGHLEFELRGQKLSGKFALIRIRAQNNSKTNQWLLIKKVDSFANEKKDVLQSDESVLTGLTLPEKKSKTKKTKAILSEFIKPELALLADRAPAGKNWIHEIKFDGYRALCKKNKDKIQLLTRSGLDWTAKYTFLQKECEKIHAKSFIIDGEIVWLNQKGISNFQGLQNALDENKSHELKYYIFDILYLNGEDLRDKPLLIRKNILANFLKDFNSEKIFLSDYWTGDGPQVLKTACQLKLEGIISKESQSKYVSERNKNWIKCKCLKLQEFVIGGYTLQNNNKSLGALLMGAYNNQGQFQYIGRVGTGFNSHESSHLLEKLKKLKSSKNYFTHNSPQLTAEDKRREMTFVKPKIVAQIEFGAWTNEKILRHAAYKGLRLDKKSKLVQLEEEKLNNQHKISHPDKILFQKSKITKEQLASYYKAIEKWILPYIKQHPLALLRCPSGVGKSCFFQKHLESDGLYILNKKVKSILKNKVEEVTYINSITGLLELVQINALELHARSCLIHEIDYPRVIVFDLDPAPGVSFNEVKKAALLLKDLLERLHLKSFLLVSGGKGLHLHVPLRPIYNFDEVKSFAKSVCEQLSHENPNHFTTELSKTKRTKKIFLDYLRNGYGATAIVPYSVRAQPEATIALPISWSMLKNVKTAKDFTMNNIVSLLKHMKNPWVNYFKTQQTIRILDRLKDQENSH